MLASPSLRTVPSRRAALAILLRRLPMVRLTIAGALAVIAAACTGEIIDPSANAAAAAEAAFKQNVAPTLAAKCASCHTDTSNPQFMKPDPTLRDGVLGFNGGALVDLDDPQQSRLAVFASSQAHGMVGTNYTPAEAAKVVAWVELEALAAGKAPAPTIETPVIMPALGANTIDLTALGLAGTSVSFDYQPLSTGMYLSRIKVAAGSGGVRLTHPLFVLWEGAEAVPDPIDRFADIDLTVAEMTESPLGGGTAVFVDVPPGAPVSLYFKAATFANGMPPSTGGGTTGGGCKAVAQFTSVVRGPLTTSCTSCHAGGNAGATAATDMTKLADDAQQPAACAQILSRISKLQPDQSAIFVAAQPNSGLNHPFKFATDGEFQAFKSAILPWVTAEAAP